MHPHGSEKTTIAHWDHVWSVPPSMRLPSDLYVAMRNVQRLLRSQVKPGMRFLEIGCAPGKLLAWVAKRLGAEVAGLDYSKPGLGYAQQLFQVLQIEGDLRYEDVFATTFEPESFDFVFSNGVIEHFDDPREIVRKHVALVKPKGKALIAIPNYSGVYGRLQHHFDPENLAIHNLTIMNLPALKQLAPLDLVSGVRAYPVGRLSLWLINFHKRWPHSVAYSVIHFFNLLGLLQPWDITGLCPLLVLELHRQSESIC